MRAFTSKISHDDVSYVELRRGEGIEGGDAIVVGVERPEENEVNPFYTAYGLIRVNRYRLRYRIGEVKLVADEAVEQALEREGLTLSALREALLKTGRLAFPKIGGRYPKVVIEISYGPGTCTAKIRVSKPG